MAVLEVIRNLFMPSASREITVIVPAPRTTYAVHPLTNADLDEVLRLNFRCFKDGENYTKHTFSYLLTQPNALCYKIVTAEKRIAGFLCVLVGTEGTGHITTIGVAPEHRRRGLAERLLGHLDGMLRERGIDSAILEVRVGNTVAQSLYRACGYTITQRLPNYYTDGEDGFMMIKPLNDAAAAA